MIDKTKYFDIARKNGHFASWAIWSDAGKNPKSNIGDVSIFDLKKNPEIINYLNPNIIMVGLNISREIETIFGNFHDSRPQAQDYKLRSAFKNTRFYGAYMTDIIKDFKQVISGKVISFLKTNKDFEVQNIIKFKQELIDLDVKNPLILAFGNDTFDILKRNLSCEYNKIVKLPHYSNYINEKDYKRKVEEELKNY
jgi:hypothetical protein